MADSTHAASPHGEHVLHTQAERGVVEVLHTAMPAAEVQRGEAAEQVLAFRSVLAFWMVAAPVLAFLTQMLR